jgi:hypothetical protein
MLGDIIADSRATSPGIRTLGSYDRSPYESRCPATALRAAERGVVSETKVALLTEQNHFYDPRALLAEGRDDIHCLNTAVGEFIHRTVHFHVPRFDLEKRVYVHEVKFEAPLPRRFPLSVRRIVGSLRSALDHAVNASKASLGSSNLNAAFPFGGDPDQFENDIKQKCCRRDVAPEIVAIIRGFKAYRGGNDDLWALNKVRNVKEHRRLVAPALAGGMMFPFEPAFPGWYRISRCNGSDYRIGYNMLSGIERGSHGGPGG